MSDSEISDEHARIQKQYSATPRKRTINDIDFEGILKLIGGCNRWQVLIYAILSAQQIPHAMFTLSVVYMMYQPDHWYQWLYEEYCGKQNKNWRGLELESNVKLEYCFPTGV